MKKHNFHILPESPWPFLLACLAVPGAFVGIILQMNNLKNVFGTKDFVLMFRDIIFDNIVLLLLSLIALGTFIPTWLDDVITESDYAHTDIVKRGLIMGFILFILSEIMLFVSMFWAWFHVNLKSTIFGFFPIEKVTIFEALNGTYILLISGLYISIGLIAYVKGLKRNKLGEVAIDPSRDFVKFEPFSLMCCVCVVGWVACIYAEAYGPATVCIIGAFAFSTAAVVSDGIDLYKEMSNKTAASQQPTDNIHTTPSESPVAAVVENQGTNEKLPWYLTDEDLTDKSKGIDITKQIYEYFFSNTFSSFETYLTLRIGEKYTGFAVDFIEFVTIGPILIISLLAVSTSFFSKDVYHYLYNTIKDTAGNKILARHVFAILLSIFLFIALMNLYGLTSGSFALTGHIIATATLAVLIFSYGLILAIRVNYLEVFTIVKPHGVPKMITGLVMAIEMLSLSIRPISLAVRLFSNILAGHILLHMVYIFLYESIFQTSLINSLLGSAGFIGVFALESGVGIIQAYVFSLLAALYIFDFLLRDSMTFSRDNKFVKESVGTL